MQNDLVEFDEEIIDAEVVENLLPSGDFIVKVNDDSFDIDVLEHFLGIDEDEIDQTKWNEFIISENNPENAYVIQGTMHFMNIQTNEIVNTNDTIVKVPEDVTLLTRLNISSNEVVEQKIQPEEIEFNSNENRNFYNSKIDDFLTEYEELKNDLKNFEIDPDDAEPQFKQLIEELGSIGDYSSTEQCEQEDPIMYREELNNFADTLENSEQDEYKEIQKNIDDIEIDLSSLADDIKDDEIMQDNSKFELLSRIENESDACITFNIDDFNNNENQSIRVRSRV